MTSSPWAIDGEFGKDAAVCNRLLSMYKFTTHMLVPPNFEYHMLVPTLSATRFHYAVYKVYSVIFHPQCCCVSHSRNAVRADSVCGGGMFMLRP